MTQHIVMFQFREDVSSEVRETARQAFKEGIEALPEVIPFIREISVHFNTNPAEKWDICLVSSFDTLDDVKAYSVHPVHQAVGKALMQYIANRACVDF